MSKIQEQIKALQTKQKKIEYLSYLADLIKNDTKCIDFKEVQAEIVSQIEPFLLELMTSIENDVKIQKKSDLQFSDEQADMLKTIADRALAIKKNEPPKEPQKVETAPLTPPSPPPQQPRELESDPNDKMNFAMNNRHLGNKRVQVLSDQSEHIYGTVVGLDSPFVHVKTDTGPTIKVPLKKIVLVPS